MKYTSSMSATTAGMYLWTIRETKKLSRIFVAAEIRKITGEGTNDVQVMRIEKGQPTSSATLGAFAEVIGANGDQVISLLADSETTIEQARTMAMDWLKQNQVIGTADEQERRRLEAIRLIDDLLDEPQKLDRLLGYGQRLLEE